MGVEISVVVPTYNERANIVPLIRQLSEALDNLSWEVIFVDDDSPDGTASLVRRLAQRDSRIRVVHRIRRRGLSSASVEGMMASSSPLVAVMDGDLQHDETLLPRMIEVLRQDDVDVVVGSRYLTDKRAAAFSPMRHWISLAATQFSRLLLRTDMTDPMSGFFVVRREVLDNVVRRLSGRGFKILLDLFVSAPRPLTYRELPYTFRERSRGESKLDAMVATEYFLLIADKLFGHIVPVRFVMFVTVGAFGAVVLVTVLGLCLHWAEMSFLVSQSIAMWVGMTFNFIFNNIFTYRDRRLGGLEFVRGLLKFYLACSIGYFATVQIGTYLFEQGVAWWIAGVLGAIVGSVWNYAVNSTITWRRQRKAPGEDAAELSYVGRLASALKATAKLLAQPAMRIYRARSRGVAPIGARAGEE